MAFARDHLEVLSSGLKAVRSFFEIIGLLEPKTVVCVRHLGGCTS